MKVASEQLNGRIPEGAIQDKWDERKFSVKLVTPANRRKFRVVVVGSGLAGASAAAIKRAYRQLAKTHHPDLGGDAEAFRRLDAAYRSLV